MSQKKAIVTRPEYDKVTSYLSSWSEELILLAKKSGINMIDLGSKKVTKKNFESYLRKQKPRLVIINGHGDVNCICGHKGEILVKKGDNEKILKDKIVYALSCHSASGLGPAAIKAGGISYIGYNSPFCFLTDKNKTCTPEKDDLANCFKESTNEIPISLIIGKTVGKAYENSQNKFREMIRSFGASNTLPEAKEMRFWLFWDMNTQDVWGDEKATI